VLKRLEELSVKLELLAGQRGGGLEGRI
jgi:hypothetical protein